MKSAHVYKLIQQLIISLRTSLLYSLIYTRSFAFQPHAKHGVPLVYINVSRQQIDNFQGGNKSIISYIDRNVKYSVNIWFILYRRELGDGEPTLTRWYFALIRFNNAS